MKHKLLFLVIIGLLISTFPAQAFAAELGHNFVEQTADQGTVSSTYVNISGAIITDANLTDGKKYLLVFTAQVGGENTNNNFEIHAIHGSTEFEGSELGFEPDATSAFGRVQYFWYTVWTAVAGEAVKLQFRSVDNTTFMSADQITMVAIKLSDDLTENTDWAFNENLTDTTLANLYATANSATLTMTPNGTDDILVLATAQLDPTSITVPQKTRINTSGGVTDTGVEWIQEGEDATLDLMVQTLVKVYTPSASSTTFTTESGSSSATGSRLYNSVFWLNLNKLRNHAQQVTQAEISLDTTFSLATSTNVATVSMTPDITGDVWALGFVILDPNTGTDASLFRMQIDNTDQPDTQTTNEYDMLNAWDATDELPFAIQSIESLSVASHTLDVDASTETNVKPVEDRLAMMVTMELPAGGHDPITATDTWSFVESTSKNHSFVRTPTNIPVISDSVTRVGSYVRSATDTPTISDSASRIGSYIRSATNTPVISDSAQVVRTRSATDTPAISDSASRIGSYVRTKTDTPTISDSANEGQSKTDTPVISDSTNTQTGYSRSATDTPAISDSTNVIKVYVRSATDTPAISDSATKIHSFVRSATDTPTILDVGLESQSKTDTPAFSDSADASQAQSYTDILSISDSTSKIHSYVRTATDTPVISDSTQVEESSAANSVYAEGQVSGVSTNCSARSTIVTLATPFASGDNTLISTIHARSTDAGNETVDVRLYKGTTLLSQNEYVVYVGASNSYNDYSIVYEDIGAGASPTYTIESCVSASAVDVSGDLVAIQGIPSEHTDGTSTALSASSDTTIVTESTGLGAGNNIVVASVQIDNGATQATITAGNIKIKNNGGSTIGSNEFDMILGTGANTDIQHITIIAEDASAGANPSYTVTVNSPQSGNAEAKILVIQPPTYTFTNGGSVGIAASETEIVSRSSTYVANSKLVVLATQQFDDTDTAIETFAAGANQLEEATVTKDDNSYLMTAWAASGSAGDGFRGDYVYGLSNNAASATWRTTATASATGINGEGKLLVIQVAAATDRSATDTWSFVESTSKIHSFTRTPTDTPVISDSASRTGSYIRSATDTPTIVDSGLVSQSKTDTPTIIDSADASQARSATDTPVISDSASKIHSYVRTATDTPAISDSANTQAGYSRSATDTPVISDSASKIHSFVRSATDTPTISDSAQATQDIFATDTPTITDSARKDETELRIDTPAISDSATRVGSYIRSATDTPVISDSTNVVKTYTRSATDTPTIVDSGQTAPGIFQPHGHYIWFICALATNSTQGCVFAEICPSGEYMIGIQNGHIVCAPLP